MWKQFDPKGAFIGGGILLVVILVAAAVLFPLPTKTVSIRLDLPPPAATQR